MDFTSQLSAFQGAIISADNVHPFLRLTSKGGNEEKVRIIIQNLKRFLEMEKYVDENGLIPAMMSSTRKFAMYIILNTDLPVLESMVDLVELEPIIWSIPTVPKFLMCELIWQLHMETFVFELIPKCWPQLGIEVAEAFMKNFKYLSPNNCLNRLGKLSAACYELLCRMTCFKLEDNELQGIYEPTIEILQKFLNYYINLPNKHKLDILSVDELYKFKGNRLKNMLHLVYECANMFTEETTHRYDDPLYKLTYSIDYLHKTTYKVYETPNNFVLEFIKNANVLLLDVFKEIVMDVSVDIFCAWSEYEEEGKTVQQGIGELCSKVEEILRSISCISDHPVIPMIQQMARKPSKIMDLVNSTDSATLLQKINNNDEESSQWIHALVYRRNLSQNMELVHVINDNLNNFDETECYLLFENFKKYSTVVVEDKEFLFELQIRLLGRCNVTDKHKILKEHFKNKIFIDNESGTDFNTQLNEMFNKFIADVNVEFTDIFTVFYQNPRKVYTKIFGLATQNTQLIETMLKLMILLKDYREYCYNMETEPCLIKVVKFLLDNCAQPTYSSNVLKIICELKKESIISSSQLLMLVIMQCMHTALIAKDNRRLHIIIQLLMDAYEGEELFPYRAPILVMVAQVMQTVRRRNLGTFQLSGLQALKTAIQFQKSIISSYNQIIPDTDGSWLRLKLAALSMTPLNLYYFKSVWNTDNRQFFESVTELRIHKRVKLNFVAVKMIQILPWAILDEWCEIWDNLIEAEIKDKESLIVFHSALDVITQRVNAHRTTNTLACQFYCYGNLVHIMRYKYLKEPLTEGQVKACLCLLSRNLKSLNILDINEVETVTMPLFAYLAERKNDYSVKVADYFANSHYANFVNRFFPSGDGESA